MSDEPVKTYTVSDGDLVLDLYRAEEGGFMVQSPMVPGLVTQGDTLEECFEMARDAREALRESWAKRGAKPLPNTRQKSKPRKRRAAATSA